MPINARKHFRSGDYSNKEILDVKKLELNQDAVSANDAVRKSQVESISDQAAQDIIVSLLNEATTNSAFSSLAVKSFLEGKQDNLEIDASSTAYLQIVDGNKIKATNLLVTDVEVNETHGTLADYISNESPTKQEGDVIILTSAADNQERSWIKTSSASQGVDGYTRLQTDYNVSTIRTMFSAGNYLSYDSASGQFALVIGNSVGELGAHSLPVDGTQFTSIVGSNILDVAKNLEALILSVESTGNNGTAVVNTRITNLVGVSESNLGDFNGLFTNDSNVKAVLIEAESAHQSATADRASIRTEFATADSALQSSINSEASSRATADTVLQANINSEAAVRSSADTTLQANINSEAATRLSADNDLDARLDVVEGGVSTVGSIQKAEADANAFTLVKVAAESNARQAADLSLQNQIDAISSAFLYRGYIGSDGRIVHIETLHSNHNVLFENASFWSGDFYKANADITITFADNSFVSLNTGDGILVINDAAAGSASASDFHKIDNTEAADIIREGMLDDTTIEKVLGIVKVKEDSIGRAQLASEVETDIDNKVLKAGDTMTGALMIDKAVPAGTGYAGGYDYAAYIKQSSTDNASLTNTQRALLVENLVYTNGSGNPFDLDFANAATVASHYKGSSNDLSVATVGINAEANTDSAVSAIYATGVYGVATSSQLGVNAGGTFVAQNAATSNLGVFAFSDTAGAANNRAAYFALSTDAVDFDAYRVARVANPLPVMDAAIIVDDYTGAKHAAYFNGKVEINGTTIVPSASADNEAVNLGDVKAKEKEFSIDVDANDNTVINHGLGTKKIIVQAWLDDEEVTSSLGIKKTTTSSITVYNDTDENIVGLEIFVYALSI